MVELIVDLHVHSKYSRATSKKLSFENIVKYARIKGVDILGTGDFTHPEYFEKIKKLEEKNGLYYFDGFPFVITGEISLMYTQGKGRRVHLCLLVPSVEVAEKIHSYLDTKGRRDYDGRPIFKISCEEFVEEMMKISEEIEVFPAHIWTPWFGVLGSKSGFDSLKEAFGKQLKNIHAIETGLSSDPPMNWRIKELDDFTILSFSDLHSFWPWRIGREATIFDLEKGNLSYKEIVNAIRENKIIGTIEVDPAYGMYHWDGHRNCKFSCNPIKSKELKSLCPVCNNKLTIGVESRIEQLADFNRGQNYKSVNAKKFYKLLPLHEIISLFTGVGISSKGNWKIYNGLIDKFGNEFNILLRVNKDE
ncbi:MAG: endonuclease Q family protein, partial [Nanoarchaeota archaeon]|nr:endonuclease Q family protein [Nanoarchaeota archaeon]